MSFALAKTRGGGWRCEEDLILNQAVATPTTAPARALAYADAARAMRRGGVGWYPGSRFVHLDTGAPRHWVLAGDGLRGALGLRAARHLQRVAGQAEAGDVGDGMHAVQQRHIQARRIARIVRQRKRANVVRPEVLKVFAVGRAIEAAQQGSASPHYAPLPAQIHAHIEIMSQLGRAHPRTRKHSGSTGVPVDGSSTHACMSAQPQPEPDRVFDRRQRGSIDRTESS